MSDALSESFFDTSLTTDLLRIPVVTSLLFFYIYLPSAFITHFQDLEVS